MRQALEEEQAREASPTSAPKPLRQGTSRLRVLLQGVALIFVGVLLGLLV